MNRIIDRKGITAVLMLTAFSLTSVSAFAENKSDTEKSMPATEHQSETAKGVKDKADEEFTNSKKKATGNREQANDDKQPPATEHQEEAIEGYEE